MQPVSCWSRCTNYLSRALTRNLIGGPGADLLLQSRMRGSAVQSSTETMNECVMPEKKTARNEYESAKDDCTSLSVQCQLWKE